MITTTRLRSIATDSIPNSTKFVALYGDGSGAKLFMTNPNGHVVNALGDTYKFSDVNTFLMKREYLYWIELPDNFKLLFERKKGNGNRI